jgi:carbon monoxide dehydrogenase subunit G
MADKQTEFGGSEEFTVPPERVFGVLTDLDRMAGLIPDLSSTNKPDQRTLEAVVKPGFSFLRGTMKLRMELADVEPPHRATMRVASQGIGVAMKIESTFDVQPTPMGCRLDWHARVTEMKGLIATVSSALVKAAADQVIRQTWKQVHAEVNG